MAYTGPSIVDYLKSVGQASDFGSRTKLATQYGITDYGGTGPQNTQLLNLLRGGAPPPPVSPEAPPPPTPPTPPVPPTPPPGGFWTGEKMLTDPVEIEAWKKAHPGGYDPNAIVPPPPTPPTPPVPPTPAVPPSTFESSLMTNYGYTIEQVRDPSFIKSKIAEIAENIKTLEAGADKENAILDFVKMAGAAGLKYEDISAYISSLAEPTESEEDRRKRIYEKYGITGIEEKAFAAPTETFETIYKRAYKDTGLAEIKEKIRAKSEEMDRATADYNEAVSKIGENPWLSEEGRMGRVKKVYDMYERKFLRLEAEYTRMSNEFTKGQESAENVATRVLSEIERGRTRTKEELSYYTKRAEADVEAELGLAEKEEEKELYRYFPDYVKSVPEKEGTPQLKQDKSGSWVWMWPSGRTESTGVTGKGKDLILDVGTVRKLAIAGVPEDVSQGMFKERLGGFSWEAIRENLIEEFGKEKGEKYFKSAREILEKAQEGIKVIIMQ